MHTAFGVCFRKILNFGVHPPEETSQQVANVAGCLNPRTSRGRYPVRSVRLWPHVLTTSRGAGSRSVVWTGEHVASGICYRTVPSYGTGTITQVRKMLVTNYGLNLQFTGRMLKSGFDNEQLGVLYLA
jgi:hypothetical protein